MRRAKVDTNQKAVVADLRKAGCSVALLHQVGKGVPDIVVGIAGINHLFEIKNPETRGKLNPDQVRWHEAWNGSVFTVTSAEEALRCMGMEHRNG